MSESQQDDVRGGSAGVEGGFGEGGYVGLADRIAQPEAKEEISLLAA